MSIPSDVSRNPTADLGTSSGMAAVIRLLAPIDLPVYGATIYIAHEYYTEYATTLYNFRYITILRRPFPFSFVVDVLVHFSMWLISQRRILQLIENTDMQLFRLFRSLVPINAKNV